MDKTIEENKEAILTISKKYGVRRLSIFGSRSRGDFSANSDIDFLIEVDDHPTAPWFPGGLVAELELLLGRRVDVVEIDSMNPGIRETVLRGAQPL